MSAAESDASASASLGVFTGRTAWARNLAAPVRDFLNTETGSALVLLGATLAALAWANSPWPHSYESFWTTKLSFQLGDWNLSMDLRHWVNQGLMTFFFLVVGLEAKREIDVGELRDRRRLAPPLVAALGGMTRPILIFLAFNAGGCLAEAGNNAAGLAEPGHVVEGVELECDLAMKLGMRSQFRS